MNRRDFLKLMGLGTAVIATNVATGTALSQTVVLRGNEFEQMGVLHDYAIEHKDNITLSSQAINAMLALGCGMPVYGVNVGFTVACMKSLISGHRIKIRHTEILTWDDFYLNFRSYVFFDPKNPNPDRDGIERCRDVLKHNNGEFYLQGYSRHYPGPRNVQPL